MASKDDWWRNQGYRNRPGSAEDEIPPGRTGEALLASDVAEIEIAQTGAEPEVYSPTASLMNGHHSPANRTTACEYYADQALLRISFPATSPASGGSYFYHDVPPDAWEALKAAPSVGRFINDVLSSHPYGKAG